jgi:hypothetical protein
MKKIVQFFRENPIVFVLLLLVVVGLIFYFVGKRKGKSGQFAKPVQGPGGGPSFNPGTYTDRAANEFDAWGVNFNGQVFREILVLPDWQLEAIVQDWQQRYAAKFNGRTFAQQLATEKDYSMPWACCPWADLRDDLIQKIQNLGYQ